MLKSLNTRVAALEKSAARFKTESHLWTPGPWMSEKAGSFSGLPVTVWQDVHQIHALGRRWDRAPAESESEFIARVRRAEAGRSQYVFAVIERNSHEVA